MTLATAESCTGGLIAATITDIPGASDVFDRGFVTYSNAAKTAMLGVHPSLIEAHGAVSEEVARSMAAGAIANSTADLAVAVTGIAGPGGGSAAKPVGLVHIAAARRDGAAQHDRFVFAGQDRAGVREDAVLAALALVSMLIDS